MSDHIRTFFLVLGFLSMAIILLVMVFVDGTTEWIAKLDRVVAFGALFFSAAAAIKK